MEIFSREIFIKKKGMLTTAWSQINMQTYYFLSQVLIPNNV